MIYKWRQTLTLTWTVTLTLPLTLTLTLLAMSLPLTLTLTLLAMSLTLTLQGAVPTSLGPLPLGANQPAPDVHVGDVDHGLGEVTQGHRPVLDTELDRATPQRGELHLLRGRGAENAGKQVPSK